MKPKSMVNSHLVFLPFLLFLVLQLSHAADTQAAGSVMKDWEFLVSPNNVFKFGFFNPAFSSNRYLGIQYMNYTGLKIVWVANRENPLLDSSGYLNITKDGKLVIHDERGTSFTINPGKPATISNISVTLLDSGNLVLKAGQQVVWQSFDHPTDTMLPGMKIGLFGLKQTQPRVMSLTSWIGPGVPAAGAFTLGVDPNNTKQLMIWRRGIPYWHSGNWNGENFTYFLVTDNERSLKFSHISNEDESYFTYTLTDYNFSWMEMNSTGSIPTFLARLDSWEYDSGSNCDVESEYTSTGCVKQKPSKCKSGDEFLLTLGTMEEWTYSNNFSLGLNDCREMCKNDCSCTAYGSASADGSGCKFSHGKRLDNPPVEWTESFYIRNSTEQNDTRIAQELKRTGPAPHIAPPISLPIKKENTRNGHQWVIIVIPLVSLVLLTIACSLCYLIWRKGCFTGKTQSSHNQVGRDTEQFIHELGTSIAAIDKGITDTLMLKGQKDYELPLFSFSNIETATGSFSEANKLGQGGFGPVYKGMLVDGQEIAVKRLSERSGQGLEEFKNEVVLISKVQHRNLVRLLGCCIKGQEKILIYEYLPNKSLDTFLFDETKRLLLDWRKRVNIIEGIAQGLLYLHKFSRLKIIHRDLKTSNILLDNIMTPKISDFGTAKIFGDNESRANTNRIVGTYGYMSPEYAMDGLFSAKSDVFSFGVMILEILSGKRNRGFFQSNDSLNLVRYAWNLWSEGRSLELMDPALAQTCSTTEFIRCVQVALLCVQESAADRPTMSDVVSMLGSDTVILPDPKQSALSAPILENDYDFLDNPGSCCVSDITNSSMHTQ